MNIVYTEKKAVSKAEMVRGGVYEGTGNRKLYLAVGTADGDVMIVDLDNGNEAPTTLAGTFIKVDVEVHVL